MQEQTQRDGNLLKLKKIPEANENIRKSGEDIAQGDLLFEQGHKLSAIDIGLLASQGFHTVNVFRRARIAIFSTGDELTPLSEKLSDGKIYDSNRYTLQALLQRLPVEIIDLGLLPDNPNIIKETLNKSLTQVDAFISTGGVSVGDADHVKAVLNELGNMHFWKIAMKPGKPFAFGKLDRSWFFGLPGNPVSTVVTYHQLVVPCLRRLTGEAFSTPQPLKAITQTDLKKQRGRADYQRAVLTNQNNINLVTSTGAQGSGVLTSMAQVNCYIVLATEQGSVKAGDLVDVIPFDVYLC
jgi:molybdopterin molybdotransferase